ncbi:2-keto-4-pentenoate hydratase/2-oxohepta-3-ene-1,7-dioic acid hydratase in catechol pathway [Pseudoduganella lurida]|uniref:2-keto-4-pentenoate hydratase/2-oxohepta-3-ene-1,7-dioic acid hydratase in catechol pathway n=1 Tax=Pseudoduganella lurida TaxID=1036180 RepID=A0A562QWM2_9BURK|nr:fumarylacetoacetate hydrolase family protein [Pseudoduganella lurida]TWI61185.1 2-keto-4-pentenoate hydratase/2-oxohepta-3-ene-1,7-dioic acid hydratase in catechol pathway [Pseudoduganella lurida]
MVQHWIRFLHLDTVRFGTLEGDKIRVFKGDMFDSPSRTDIAIALPEVTLLTPVVPGKVLAMWNNYHALGQKLGLAPPAEPLYLMKPANSYLAPGGTIRKPRVEAKVAFEGELAIVIGRRCSGVSVESAPDHIFGYTCANDVTVNEIIGRDPTFPQWVRAKGFDTFCPFGPMIATGLNPAMLVVRTILNGEVRQDYPVNDMVFSVAELVSKISQDMTLEPGDLLLCGTSIGVGSMRPGSTIAVEIDGIGTLSNRFE